MSYSNRVAYVAIKKLWQTIFKSTLHILVSTSSRSEALQYSISAIRALFIVAFMCGPFAANAANLTGLNIAPTNPTLSKGQSLPMTATGSFDDGTQRILKQVMHIATNGTIYGGSTKCAVVSDGAIQCWGDLSIWGGAAINAAPVTLKEIPGAVSMAVGTEHICVLINNGTVQCWGDNRFGQLGNGTTSTTRTDTPVIVSGIANAVAVVAKGGHANCALFNDGPVKCWGSTYGPNPALISGINTAVAISAGGGNFCAVLADGTAHCWGTNNYFGQLGDGTNTGSMTPRSVVGITNAVSISGSDLHTCAALADGKIKCWGDNASGQLGDGTTTQSLTPVEVNGVNNAVSVAVDHSYSCALLGDGSMKCWGTNSSGQFGNGTTTDSLLPTPAAQIGNAVSMIAAVDHACALLSDGTARCWGKNLSGQLGNNGNTNNSLITPTAVVGISNSTAVSGFDRHKCSLQADGSVTCWGVNDAGQLGDGTTTTAFSPVTVMGISNAVAVSAGVRSSCAVLSNGSIQCWGARLGNGSLSASSLTPVTVSGITNAVSVSVGFDTTCALLVDGIVMCWGASVGDGTGVYSTTPKIVPGISGAVSMSTSGGSVQEGWDGQSIETLTCVVLSDGTVKCWGFVRYRPGPGSTSYFFNSSSPVVMNVTNALSISSAGKNACALLADGKVTCWYFDNLGANYFNVSGINNAVKVTAGLPMCAVLATGEVRCWESNGIVTAVASINNATGVASTVDYRIDPFFVKSNTCVNLADRTIQCWGDNTDGALGLGFNASGYYLSPETVVGYDSLIWSSSNPSVVSITATGVASARSPGVAIITASAGGISANASVTAGGSSYALSTMMLGNGSGIISGAGVYYAGQSAAVSATANPGSAFSGWTDLNAVECATGSVLMNTDKVCTGTFILNTYTLSISTAGNGVGSVSGGGTYNYGISAVINATANTGSTFAGWSGSDGVACASGSVLMNVNRSCTATFTLIALSDLTPTALTAWKWGTKVTVKDTVKNQGNSNIASAFTVGYYLSTNMVYEAGIDIPLASNSNRNETCTRSISSLNTGESNTGRVSCYKPTVAKKDVHYYVLAVDDAGNVITESNELNNVKATRNTVHW